MSEPSYECERYLPTFPSSEKVPVLILRLRSGQAKEGNKEGRRLFLPFVSGRISEERMRVG